MRKHEFTDYSMVASSSVVPAISILAPAYNESASIVENVRSLFSIYYNNLELIVINDGSKDDSLQKLIDAYHLVKVPYFVNERIATKPVRGVYKSTNAAYKKLTVVDKYNGGKADALNVGLNIATKKYVTCIDVDCVLEQDALLRMVKPFMSSPDKHVIAAGGVIRVANSCEVRGGKITKVHVPKNMLARIQTVEYIRSFLLGRMAWSKLNGLLIISGAFGMFDKEIAIDAGGYDTKTVGEDMELIVRMRLYMEDAKRPYAVRYISDPLCWTEVPTSYRVLWRQRDRWMRGTVETLWTHKKMFFNRKYGVLGLFSYPYWVFFEFLAPIVELLGWVFLIVYAVLGMVIWKFYFLLLIFIVSFGYLFSASSILIETFTFRQYKEKRDVLKLLLAVLYEPVIFHLYVVAAAIRGILKILLKSETGWGEMTRGGFAKKNESVKSDENQKLQTETEETANHVKEENHEK
ncbi:glycosyltransferase [Labilibaculum sp. K2S]|uniref:glycosyltransferase family 2 protein n=1 Tax=Labilibaculum sp. K2S TaxID=3056386 RepID=UPI0025A36545|nr:glycosyltransferase [Labilibaculum sp. K2S]MDM8161849.1 glycosyltransferase [Labilibaculum sp. K2S]